MQSRDIDKKRKLERAEIVVDTIDLLIMPISIFLSVAVVVAFEFPSFSSAVFAFVVLVFLVLAIFIGDKADRTLHEIKREVGNLEAEGLLCRS